jgi:tRNA (guanine9-N1)-methyltransferase
MAESEERQSEGRPSKIRKLEPPAQSNDDPLLVNNLGARERPEVASSEPMNHLPEDAGEAPSLDGKEDGGDQPNLSKSQLKKLRKAAQWEAAKESRKAKRREKHKEKQARKAEQRSQLEAKIINGEAMIVPAAPDEERPKGSRRPVQVPVALILDCNFNELMMEKELISLGAQLTRSYSENKKNPYRTHLALSSWGGALKSRFETVLANNHLSWKGVKFFEEDFLVAAENLDEIMKSKSGGTLAGGLVKVVNEAMEIKPSVKALVSAAEGSGNLKEMSNSAEAATSMLHEILQNKDGDTISATVSTVKSRIELNSISLEESPSLGEDPPTDRADSPKASPLVVYLTSDSPHTLQYLSPNTSYIIGGIVDKNRHKGLCYKRACEMGIPTAKLPIGEYMTMQSRSVLAINHVVEIMLKWLVTGDWGEAFLSVIPKRKEAKLKTKNCEENHGQDEDSQDEEEGGTLLSENNAVEASEGAEAAQTKVVEAFNP